MKYIHKFKTEEEFDSQYNTSAYTEPWVSLTNEGSCDYFVGNIEGTGQFTYYFAGMDSKSGEYVFVPGTKQKITNIYPLPGEISEDTPQITVNGVVYTYAGNYGPGMYPLVWETEGGQCYTKDRYDIGDEALVDDDIKSLYTSERTPEVGEIINTVEVISVHTPVNIITYNKNFSFRVEVVELPEASFTNNSLTLTITQEMLDEWSQHYSFSKAAVEVARKNPLIETTEYAPIVASINGEPVPQDEARSSSHIFVNPPMTIEYLPIVNGDAVTINLVKIA